MNQQRPPAGTSGASDARTAVAPPVHAPVQHELGYPAQTFPHQLRPLSPMQIELLMRAIDEWRVSSRSGNSYVEGHDVKAMLIRIFGFGGFSSETVESTLVYQQQVPQTGDKSKLNWKIASRATVRLTIHQLGAVYQETAIAGSAQPDWTESADMATKSAETDALKRAAIFLGTQFGLSLYANGALDDQIVFIAEPAQAAALAEERQRLYDEWARQQAALAGGVPPQTPQAPAGAPYVAQQGQPPTVASSAAQAAAQSMLAEGLNN